MARLDEVLLGSRRRRAVLVAHSLGCQLVAAWAAHSRTPPACAARCWWRRPTPSATTCRRNLHQLAADRAPRACPSRHRGAAATTTRTARSTRAERMAARLGRARSSRRPARPPQCRVRPRRLARGPALLQTLGLARNGLILTIPPWSPRNPRASASASKRCSAPRSRTSATAAAPTGRPPLKLDQLQPGKYQPRTRMDEGSLYELAESIKAQGMMQPILVRPVGAEPAYEIIAGERRIRAAQAGRARRGARAGAGTCPTRPPR